MSGILFILVLGIAVWITVHNIRLLARGDDLSILPRVEEEFRALVVTSDLPELCFDGRTAEIVISEGSGRPFFKHVSQINAKIALGKKYLAPTPIAG
jgi:hypothetical protein